MKTIGIVGEKGGVGKTTTTVELAAGLTQKGYKVLILDLDMQTSATKHILGRDNASGGKLVPNIYHAIMREADLKDCIRHTSFGDIVPGTPEMKKVEKLEDMDRTYRVKEALATVDEIYDYCIIDTPPAIGVITGNAFTACDGVVITAQADPYSIDSFDLLLSNITGAKKYTNPKLKVLGILIVRYSKRAVIKQQLLEQFEQLARILGTKIYDTKIRECVAILEAQAMEKDIFSYSPKCNAAIDYMSFVDEIINE